MRGLSDQLTETLTAAAQHERLVFLCSFQKEESVPGHETLSVISCAPASPSSMAFSAFHTS